MQHSFSMEQEVSELGRGFLRCFLNCFESGSTTEHIQYHSYPRKADAWRSLLFLFAKASADATPSCALGITLHYREKQLSSTGDGKNTSKSNPAEEDVLKCLKSIRTGLNRSRGSNDPSWDALQIDDFCSLLPRWLIGGIGSIHHHLLWPGAPGNNDVISPRGGPAHFQWSSVWSHLWGGNALLSLQD